MLRAMDITETQTKFCPGCNTNKVLDDFPNQTGRKFNKFYICRVCKAEQDRQYRKSHPELSLIRSLRLYNCSREEYEELLKKQDNKCAICKSDHPNGGDWKKRFCIDHDHKTNKIRGLLCSTCNSALGKFKDDPEILKVAIAYLEDNSE